MRDTSGGERAAAAAEAVRSRAGAAGSLPRPIRGSWKRSNGASAEIEADADDGAGSVAGAGAGAAPAPSPPVALPASPGAGAQSHGARGGGAAEQKSSSSSSSSSEPSGTSDTPDGRTFSSLWATSLSVLNTDIGSWFGMPPDDEDDNGEEGSSDEESNSGDDGGDGDDGSESDSDDEVESSRGLDKAFGRLGLPGWLLPATRLTVYEFGLGTMRLAKLAALLPWYVFTTLLSFIASAAFPGSATSKLRRKRRREHLRARKAREIIRKMKAKYGEDVLRERRAENTSLWTFLKRDVDDVLFDEVKDTNEALELLDLGLGLDVESQ